LLDDERSGLNWWISDRSKIQNGQIKAGDEIVAVEGEESSLCQIVDWRVGVVEEDIDSDSNLVAVCNQGRKMQDGNEGNARESIEIFDDSFKVVEGTNWSHSSSNRCREDVMDIQLSSHNQLRSRRSESKIELHNLLLSDGVGLCCSGVRFTFGSIDAVRISILIDDLSWRIALLAVRISISPVDSKGTSTLVARSCIADES